MYSLSRWKSEKQKKKRKTAKEKEKRNPKDVNRNVNNTRDDNVVVAASLLVVVAAVAAVNVVVADALCRIYFTPSAALHPTARPCPTHTLHARPAQPVHALWLSQAKQKHWP